MEIFFQTSPVDKVKKKDVLIQFSERDLLVINEYCEVKSAHRTKLIRQSIKEQIENDKSFSKKLSSLKKKYK